MRKTTLALLALLAACNDSNPDLSGTDKEADGGTGAPPYREPDWDGGQTLDAQVGAPPTAPPTGGRQPDAGAPPTAPPTQPPPPEDPNDPQDPNDPADPNDPEDPQDPADPEDPPPPPPVDECADAGAACDVCACRLCSAEVDACFADPACQAVVECAQRTGCDGVDCLQVCGEEINAAGGPFGESVARAQAIGTCREQRCGMDDASCQNNDPGPPEPPPPPPDDPQDPPPPDDPQDPPPPEDACADAGGACDVCTCRLCSAELQTCFADPLCQAVVECAQRTGCQGFDCLGACGNEINAAGGPFGESTGRAQAVSDCRDQRCGADERECEGNAPPPPPPPDPEEPGDPPQPGGCDRFPATQFCGQGVTANGVAWCEFFVESDEGRSCDEICARVGSRCLDAWDEDWFGDDACITDHRIDCDDDDDDLICRCTQ